MVAGLLVPVEFVVKAVQKSRKSVWTAVPCGILFAYGFPLFFRASYNIMPTHSPYADMNIHLNERQP